MVRVAVLRQMLGQLILSPGITLQIFRVLRVYCVQLTL